MMPLLQTAAEYCGKKIKNRSSSGSEYSSNFLTHGGPTAGFFCCIVDCRSTLSQLSIGSEGSSPFDVDLGR